MPGTIGNTENNKNVTQNSYNNTYNLVTSLSVQPEAIKLEAIVNHNWIVYLLMFGQIYIVFSLVFYFQNSELLNLYIVFETLVFFFGVVYGLNKLLFKFSALHVVYENGTIKINGKDREFYKDIWKMTYKKDYLSEGASISVYGVDKDSKRPYKYKLNFMLDGEARYVYDSFWNEERIEEFKKGD